MIWYRVGSADEPGGITGVSHVLEHLMFKGTPKFPLGVFSKKISEIGGQENAFTNYDYTAYFEKIAANQIEVSFMLEADRMRNLSFNSDKFNREMKVIQEERRMRTDNDPQAKTLERFLAGAHLASPYHHPVIGWMSDLKQMKVDDARYWYNKFYNPKNAILVVVGDVKPKQIYHLAKKYFSGIPGKEAFKRKKQMEPPRLGPKKIEVRIPAQIPLVMVGYTVPSIKSVEQKNNDPYVLEVIAGILDASDSGRLMRNLIRGKQTASQIDIYYNLYSHYQTQFIIYGTISQSSTTTELEKGILNELNHLKEQPLSALELQRVKTQIIAEKTFEKDSIFGQAMELGVIETIGLPWQISDQYIDHINQVSAKEIQEVARRYFTDRNKTEAILIPTFKKPKEGKV